MGTTGFAFQLFGNYIYIQSDILQKDYPDGTLTRVVSLETGAIIPFARNVDIFVPDEGEYVYYTNFFSSSIFKAGPSLTSATEFIIEIPEQDRIDSEYGGSEDLCIGIIITDVSDGWICFQYYAYYYEDGEIYEGGYRIRTDGTRLEKTDEGQFY